jgi:prophage maintenance system killer protein
VIGLDLADLVVIAGRALGIGAEGALESIDVPAAREALAEAGRAEAALAQAARVAARGPGAGAVTAWRADSAEATRAADRAGSGQAADCAEAAAAAAGVALMRALLVHRPFPRDGMRVAAIAGLQFLAVNGWRAELEPPEAAAVVIEALASGRLSPDAATDWLAARLRPQPVPVFVSEPAFVPEPAAASAFVSEPAATSAAAGRRARAALRMPGVRRPVRGAGARPGRRLISALIAVGLGSLAMLATACAASTSNDAPGPAYHVTSPRSPSASCPPAQCW